MEKVKKKEVLNKRMSFVEHLEELRWVLLKCIVFVLAFTILSYIFSLPSPRPESTTPRAHESRVAQITGGNGSELPPAYSQV